LREWAGRQNGLVEQTGMGDYAVARWYDSGVTRSVRRDYYQVEVPLSSVPQVEQLGAEAGTLLLQRGQTFIVPGWGGMPGCVGAGGADCGGPL